MSPCAPGGRSDTAAALDCDQEDVLDITAHRYTGGEREHWLRLALGGDNDALGCLLASYMPQLYRVALRLLRSPQDAEDALQDGLLSALRHFREFQGRSQIATWLTRIVINAALMQLRSGRARPTTSIDEKADGQSASLAATIPDPKPGPEQICVQRERLEILHLALQGLCPSQREALWLRDIQGMSTTDAAEALAVPETTLKSQVHRARLRLIKGARRSLDSRAPLSRVIGGRTAIGKKATAELRTTAKPAA